MPKITIVVEDGATGDVSIESDDKPEVGQRCSRAQIIAREIVNRTCKEYGLAMPTKANHYVFLSGESKPLGDTDRRFYIVEA